MLGVFGHLWVGHVVELVHHYHFCDYFVIYLVNEMSIDEMCCFYGDHLIYFCLANEIVVEVVCYFCDRRSSCSCSTMIVIDFVIDLLDLMIGIGFAVVAVRCFYDHQISLIYLVNVIDFVIG